MIGEETVEMSACLVENTVEIRTHAITVGDRFVQLEQHLLGEQTWVVAINVDW